MIAVIDYGVGNLRSVEKALHYLGYEAMVSSDEGFIREADAVILPGVGAFANAMERLRELKMVEMIHRVVDDGKPFMGICLGMQLLFEYSEEGGKNKGLGLLPGGIKLIPSHPGLKVPHMGWNKLSITRDNCLLEGLPQSPYVYFVHSYYLEAEVRQDVIATVEYGVTVDAAVNRGNLFATQFHPEKSGEIGLKILDNFAKFVERGA